MRVVLRDTAVGELDPTSVGCGNFWERTYTLPDGTEQSGLTARLAPFDQEEAIVVGLGSRVSVGGEDWVVDDIVKFDVGSRPNNGVRPAELHLRTADHMEPAVVIDGHNFSVDVTPLVKKQLETGTVGGSRDAQSPLEWLSEVRARLEEAQPRLARQLSRAVGRCFGDDDAVNALVASWFDRYPLEPGGERLQEAVAADAERWDMTTADDTAGAHTPNLRQNLVRAAYRWTGNYRQLPDALRDLVREEVLAGDGESLLFEVFRRDEEWAAEHIDALLALYPSRASAVFKHLINSGMSPDDALDKVLPATDDAGRSLIGMVIGLSPRIPDQDRARLTARL